MDPFLILFIILALCIFAFAYLTDGMKTKHVRDIDLVSVRNKHDTEPKRKYEIIYD